MLDESQNNHSEWRKPHEKDYRFCDSNIYKILENAILSIIIERKSVVSGE